MGGAKAEISEDSVKAEEMDDVLRAICPGEFHIGAWRSEGDEPEYVRVVNHRSDPNLCGFIALDSDKLARGDRDDLLTQFMKITESLTKNINERPSTFPKLPEGYWDSRENIPPPRDADIAYG